MPHPATMFFLLTLGVIFLSWIFDVYGLSVRLPHTGEEIRVYAKAYADGYVIRGVSYSVLLFWDYCPM